MKRPHKLTKQQLCLLDMPIGLGLPDIYSGKSYGGRLQNALRNDNIRSVRELIAHTETSFLRIPNVGRGCLNLVKEELAKCGLALGSEYPAPPIAAAPFDTQHVVALLDAGARVVVVDGVEFTGTSSTGITCSARSAA